MVILFQIFFSILLYSQDWSKWWSIFCLSWASRKETHVVMTLNKLLGSEHRDSWGNVGGSGTSYTPCKGELYSVKWQKTSCFQEDTCHVFGIALTFFSMMKLNEHVDIFFKENKNHCIQATWNNRGKSKLYTFLALYFPLKHHQDKHRWTVNN